MLLLWACSYTAFALLKDGFSWYDNSSRLLLTLERLEDCPGSPGLPLWNHSALGFYGGSAPTGCSPSHAPLPGS